MQLPDKLDAKTMTEYEWESLRRSAGVRRYDILDHKMGLMDRHFIQSQRLSETSGQPGSYEKWLFDKQAGDEGIEGAIAEIDRANPDSLRTDEAMYASSQPTEAQFIMGDAVGHLQGIQKQVYILTFREGLSLAQAGEKLGLSKSQVQGYRTRAVKFVEQFCLGVLKNVK